MSSGLSISPMSWSFKTKHPPLGASSVAEHTRRLYGPILNVEDTTLLLSNALPAGSMLNSLPG